MSVMIDLPPALEKEVQGCSLFEGTSLEQLFLDYLWKECERRRTAQNARVTATSAKRRDLTPDPELHCEIKCDLFADESADWESA